MSEDSSVVKRLTYASGAGAGGAALVIDIMNRVQIRIFHFLSCKSVIMR